jgi:hypothetical protein
MTQASRHALPHTSGSRYPRVDRGLDISSDRVGFGGPSDVASTRGPFSRKTLLRLACECQCQTTMHEGGRYKRSRCSAATVSALACLGCESFYEFDVAHAIGTSWLPDSGSCINGWGNLASCGTVGTLRRFSAFAHGAGPATPVPADAEEWGRLCGYTFTSSYSRVSD